MKSRDCEKCDTPMTREGTATTDTHHTTWWSCKRCDTWIKDSQPSNPVNQGKLL